MRQRNQPITSTMSATQRRDLALVASLRALSLLGDEIAVIALTWRQAHHGSACESGRSSSLTCYRPSS